MITDSSLVIEPTATAPAKTGKPKRRMARPPADESIAEPAAADGTVSGTSAAAPRGNTKIASVIALLKRGEGATLAELIDATGWLPHTTRAALAGLKKKGHAIAKAKRGTENCYNIVRASE